MLRNMAATLGGIRAVTSRFLVPICYGQARNFAARKGTREKARKKKVKVEIKKVAWVPPKLREKKDKLPLISKRLNDSHKPVSSDDVWIGRYYQWRVYDFVEAVQCHRETHHPTMYNVPDAPLFAFIELDMSTDKKTKFVDNFTRVAGIPHPFEHGEDRSVIVFAKTQEEQKIALEAGATVAGGMELITDIQNGNLSMQDFKYAVAHPSILPELASVRGLFRRKFPNIKNGTLGPDIAEIVKRFAHGICYTASRDERELDYGTIEAQIGILTMDPKHLEENFAALLQDVHAARTRKKANFITRTLLTSPPSRERFKIDHGLYVEVFRDVREEDSEAKTEDEFEEADVKQSTATG
ncbi:39S ribosomal protein L1, mitochondrial [Schistocerca americana]|uniref:39S ribosomal protein L1, mitochondrial n=1 Tax=Schistocerca americana TaxID=7009 RepID=UPI001F4F708A|nr:39S ribosomal protein L1, mitochondrial [Schistocerca americana]